MPNVAPAGTARGRIQVGDWDVQADGEDAMNATIIASLVSAASIAGAGWGAHVYLSDTYAERGQVQLAGAKADFVLDRQMAAIISEIAYLERVPNPTPAQLAQLQYLRQQLEQMRRVRAGK
jgi:hypothetical protein